MPFVWYRDSLGHFVGQQAINQAVDQVIASTADTLRSLTGELQAGKITLADWQVSMAAQLKLLHLGAAMIGAGGRDQMTQSDWGWTGSQLKQQYAYLRSFANEIATGATPMDGRLVTRAALYAEAARGTQREMMRRVAIDNGREEERNQMGGSEHHCSECPSLSAMGWVPIGTLPPIGSRQCMGRCKCSLQYRGGLAA